MSGRNFNYELLFDLSPDLLCIAGYDGYFKRINPAVSNLLGYTMEELYTRPINDFVYHEDQETTSKVREELRKAKPLLNFENRYVTKSGEIIWLSWTSLPVEADQSIFAIAKNITHKKQHEAERNAMLAKLTKVNKDLKQLTYMTSHDLRSPVNSFLSLLSLIDVSKISDPPTLELIEVIKYAGENLKQTLNNYVDSLSIKYSVQKEEVDLQEALDNVLKSIHSLIQTSKATIHIDFARLHKINFNLGYVESIFLNLISNSIKYARPDVLPVISIYTEKVEGISRLTVSDNGTGFDMEKVKDKIFGLHQQFHDYTDSKGIGLYLVHTHVTSLGGEVHVESKINEGTTFIISFKE
jgi:PAS domain S-box-containing protein